MTGRLTYTITEGLKKMKIVKVCLIASIFALGLISSAFAMETYIDQERLVEAIGKAENSVKYPYGIKSINTHGDKVLARKICLNTVNNNIARWQWARQNGDTRDFIEFLGARFCPTINATDDPTGLNKNWVKNVRYLYEKY